MSDKDYGGKMTVKTSTGLVFAMRGDLVLKPSRFSSESVTNQDLSVDRILTPKPASAAFTFADRGQDFDNMMQSDWFNITFDEDNTGVTHYFTSAFFVGDPESSRKNGEVSGVSVDSENYARRKAS